MKQVYSNLDVSYSPHLVTNVDTRRTMALVMIALLPATLVSTYVFGMDAIIMIAVCIAASVIFEALFNIVMKRRQTVSDLSAALTGFLIAFNVPSGLPLWIAIIGCFVAIIIVKQVFGGLGKNFANPAITARIVLVLSFTTEMTTWVSPNIADSLTGATPLGELQSLPTDAGVLLADGNLPNNMSVFLGLVDGSLGEISALALIIGGLYLIFQKVISYIIPASFIGTVFVGSYVYYSFVEIDVSALQMAIFHVCAGGVMLGAFFMATDYVTSPILPLGKLIFGVGCGVLTLVIRFWATYPEGVSFAILLMNILTPLIDDLATKILSGGGKNAKVK